MENSGDLQIEFVEIREEGENYRFRVFPMIHSKEDVILCKQQLDGEMILAQWSESSDLVIPKSRIEEQAYMCLIKRKGEKRGTPVRISTVIPEVSQMALLPYGQARIFLEAEDKLAAGAGLCIERDVEGRKRVVYLEQGVYEFSMQKIGILGTERERVRFQINYWMEDTARSRVAGPVREMELILHPPEILRIVKEETAVVLRFSEEPKSPLYARISRDGIAVSTIACVKKEGGIQERGLLAAGVEGGANTGICYEMLIGQLGVLKGAYTLEIACQNGLAYSYWSAAVPLLTEPPVIESAWAGQGKCTIQLKEKGYYFWQEKCEWTEQIQVDGKEIPQIRYAGQYGGVLSLGPPVREPEHIENRFCRQDGYYQLAEAEMVCPLRESYKAYQNQSFQIRIESGRASLVITKDCGEDVEPHVRELLAGACTSYAGLEELTGCFGHMPLSAENMLGVRYGFDMRRGMCDLHAGMELCLDHEQYQDMQELISENKELSGFVGNGGSFLPCIEREGKVTFEPFAQRMIEHGGMCVESLNLSPEGTLELAGGMWDTLSRLFTKPFVRLVFPLDWKKSNCDNRGSVSCFENVCLISSNSYQSLEEAARQYREGADVTADAGYICFRGRTAVRVFIHIFVEGHPERCALGTTVGDISKAYGLGSEIRLERLCNGNYESFADIGPEIPLFIGDRICSS